MINPAFNAIATNILFIESRLARASLLANSAHQAAQQGKQNLAIGTLMPLQHELADTEALLRTVFVLHRSRADATEGPMNPQVPRFATRTVHERFASFVTIIVRRVFTIEGAVSGYNALRISCIASCRRTHLDCNEMHSAHRPLLRRTSESV